MSFASEEPPELRLRIEKAIYGGAGLARHQGKAIFTPWTLPGEIVTAKITHSKDSFAQAALLSVLEPSADRTSPPCPYFGVCGGCHYQHAIYPAQLAIKASILEETLTRAHIRALPEIGIHAGDPLHYRNRIRLHINPFSSALSYRERGSHRLLPVSSCPIAALELQQALTLLGPLSARQQWSRCFSQLELSVNHDGSEIMLALWASSLGRAEEAAAQLAPLCDEIKRVLPSFHGAGVHAPLAGSDAHRAAGARRQRGRPVREQSNAAEDSFADEKAGPSLTGSEDSGVLVATWGAPQMTYRVAGLDYRVSLGAFFQANRTLLDRLASLPTQERQGSLAWDLYAGVGLFSRVLAGRFDRVVAIEGAPISARDLRSNLASPHQAIRESTVGFLRRQVERQSQARGTGRWPKRSAFADSAAPGAERPDFVLVDPPRAGLGSEITQLLSQIRPARITYVSCDPATLARDLRALLESGYQLQQLHLIDLFPQTFHLETVAVLSLA